MTEFSGMQQSQMGQSAIEGRVKHKIVFLGNQSVGKTSIIERYIYEAFDEKSHPTIGVDFVAKNIQLENRTIRLLLWDTAGQERFHSLIPSYLREAACAIIVFDLTKSESFDQVEKWLEEVRELQGNDILVVMVGNKLDLVGDRKISSEQAKKYARVKEVAYFEVSAKTGEGIDQVFRQICMSLGNDSSMIFNPVNMLPNDINNSDKKEMPKEKEVNKNPAGMQLKLENKKDNKNKKSCC